MVKPNSLIELGEKRQRVSDIVENPKFIYFITALILINAITLGLETDANVMKNFGVWLLLIDRIILVLFTVELILKFYAYRLSFFRSGWNTFDFIIVSIAWIPTTGALSVLRALRILRVLRLLTVVPQLRRVISALGHSIPGMTSIIGVLCIIFYVSAVLTTSLFGDHPDQNMQEWFGTVGASAYTLFQIMTLESWSMGIVRPVMEYYPLSWIFFLPFIIITSFAVLNLFIGIIVDAMQVVQKETRQIDKAEMKEFTHEELVSLHNRFDKLHAELKRLNSDRKRE